MLIHRSMLPLRHAGSSRLLQVLVYPDAQCRILIPQDIWITVDVHQWLLPHIQPHNVGVSALPRDVLNEGEQCPCSGLCHSTHLLSITNSTKVWSTLDHNRKRELGCPVI